MLLLPECEIICFSCTGLSEGEKCHNAISCAENEVIFCKNNMWYYMRELSKRDLMTQKLQLQVTRQPSVMSYKRPLKLQN